MKKSYVALFAEGSLQRARDRAQNAKRKLVVLHTPKRQRRSTEPG